jgi:tetratricopeptide (TPR) repeat protein
VQKAAGLADQVSLKEKYLIEALITRQSADTAADLNVLNQVYMTAMQEVARQYPDDPDILTLYADAVMNTMPWNYWDAEGNPNPGTLDAKKALESAIALNPDHPGAHHSYIHMVELPHPDLGVPSAEKLGSFMPGAGHLVHMPSHIFIRVGRYEEAVKANIDAVAADEDYISQCQAQGMYPLGYYPHNIHFLWSASSLLGDSKTAIEAAKKTAEKVSIGELTTLTFLQDYITTPMLAYTRCGKWNDVLTIPNPGDTYKHVMLIWHYTRGIAFLHKNNIQKAEEELAAIEQLMLDPEMDNLVANYTNPSSSIAKVAQRVVAGEIAAAHENYDHAVALLQEGVAFEDGLIYSEPTAWHIPVRQNLGAVLLKADRPAEAEAVYKEELEKNRENGWSLKGLYLALQAQGKTQEANEVMLRFEKAWALSDIKIDGSVM